MTDEPAAAAGATGATRARPRLGLSGKLLVLTLLFVMIVRILEIVLPSGVWVAYLVLGLVLVIAGAVLMRKRRTKLEAIA